MNYCIFCLRGLAAPIPTGAIPLCACCRIELDGLPITARMSLSTKAAAAIEQSRQNDGLRMLAIQFGDLIDAAKERAN